MGLTPVLKPPASQAIENRLGTASCTACLHVMLQCIIGQELKCLPQVFRLCFRVGGQQLQPLQDTQQDRPPPGAIRA